MSQSILVQHLSKTCYYFILKALKFSKITRAGDGCVGLFVSWPITCTGSCRWNGKILYLDHASCMPTSYFQRRRSRATAASRCQCCQCWILNSSSSVYLANLADCSIFWVRVRASASRMCIYRECLWKYVNTYWAMCLAQTLFQILRMLDSTNITHTAYTSQNPPYSISTTCKHTLTWRVFLEFSWWRIASKISGSGVVCCLSWGGVLYRAGVGGNHQAERANVSALHYRV